MIEILNVQGNTGCELMHGDYNVLAKLPEGATVGDMVMAMFPNGDLHNKETEGNDWGISYPNKVCYEINYHSLWFDEDLWNNPYNIFIEKVETNERDAR